MNTITTKYGSFGIENNGKNGAMVYVGKNKVAEFPRLNWWDADKVRDAIEMNIEMINRNLAKQTKTDAIKVTRDNAIEVFEQLASVLGNEEKGFYSSRIKQCINKLKTAA